MREMPYIQPYHVGNRRGGNQNILDEFREFLDARRGRGGRGGRGGMRNRIGYTILMVALLIKMTEKKRF